MAQMQNAKCKMQNWAPSERGLRVSGGGACESDELHALSLRLLLRKIHLPPGGRQNEKYKIRYEAW